MSHQVSIPDVHLTLCCSVSPNLYVCTYVFQLVPKKKKKFSSSMRAPSWPIFFAPDAIHIDQKIRLSLLVFYDSFKELFDHDSIMFTTIKKGIDALRRDQFTIGGLIKWDRGEKIHNSIAFPNLPEY